jgi:hypothetical protein
VPRKWSSSTDKHIYCTISHVHLRYSVVIMSAERPRRCVLGPAGLPSAHRHLLGLTDCCSAPPAPVRSAGTACEVKTDRGFEIERFETKDTPFKKTMGGGWRPPNGWNCAPRGSSARGQLFRRPPEPHDISTDCFGGRSFYDLGGIFTYQTARKAPAIHWGSPIGSQKKNIFSVLVDHFRAPEHPCEWWLQRSSRRRWWLPTHGSSGVECIGGSVLLYSHQCRPEPSILSLFPTITPPYFGAGTLHLLALHCDKPEGISFH